MASVAQGCLLMRQKKVLISGQATTNTVRQLYESCLHPESMPVPEDVIGVIIIMLFLQNSTDGPPIPCRRTRISSSLYRSNTQSTYCETINIIVMFSKHTILWVKVQVARMIQVQPCLPQEIQGSQAMIS